jgi:hypothetical protein
LGNTAFGKALVDKLLQNPEPGTLPNSEKKLPFVFVGDGAFSLTENFMKPYGQTGLSAEQRIFLLTTKSCTSCSRKFIWDFSFWIRCTSATYCAISSESPNNCLNVLLFARLFVKKPGTNVHFTGLSRN